MNLRLQLSMVGTVALILAVSTLGFSVILSMTGTLDLYSLIFMVALFNIAQWLLAPYLINRLYGVRPFDPEESPHLHKIVRDLSMKSGINPPKLMFSKIPIPNAFAYGSPLAGNHVAVTQGLLSELETEEVEAVIGHELGHIKHRDVQVMMFISMLPSLFYMLARSSMFSQWYGNRDRRDSGGLAVIGGVSMAIYFFLLLFNLGLSRLREYYADQHSAEIVEDGARKLSEGLAKISSSSWKIQRGNYKTGLWSGFKCLLISDPDRAGRDASELGGWRTNASDDDLVADLANRQLTFFDRFAEVFSTHPNIVKRIQALKENAL